MMSASHLPATDDSLVRAAEAKTPSEAISILYQALENPSSSSEALRIKEKAISYLSNHLRQEGRAVELKDLLTKLRPFFSWIPVAKTAKIVRSIVDAVSKVPGASELQISLCREIMQWARAEKRSFLRQRIEAKLAAHLMDNHEYSESLNLLSGLVKEVRRLDDKLLLIEIELLQSKLHLCLRNLSKAKTALTSARVTAYSIYVPPAQQAKLDLQNAIIHAEENSYSTAYSYFCEAFESFDNLKDPQAIYSLKYMLLCRIMAKRGDDVGKILWSPEMGLKYQGTELDGMKAVADAHSTNNLRLLETALEKYKAQLEEDPIVHRHLASMYDTLLEQNLCRLIEPYSRVETAYLGELVEMPAHLVEMKLSRMILENKFAGTLDQSAGCLIIYDDDPNIHAMYPATLDILSNMEKVVDILYVKSAKIVA